MHPTDPTPSALRALADALRSRRTDVLACWRQGVALDPALPDTTEWTEVQLLDHFPEILDRYEQLLTVWPNTLPGLWRRHTEKAQAHARYRWLQGFALRTVIHEWNGLNRCMQAEIARFFAARPGSLAALDSALQVWGGVLEHHLTESVIAFEQLQQAEAATRGQEIADALHRLRELQAARSQALNATTQEIRDRLSVAQTSVSVMADSGLDARERAELRELTQSSFDSVVESLASVAALCRLEAGADPLTAGRIDAGAVMANACSDLARELEAMPVTVSVDGPDELAVEGDAMRLPLLLRHLALTAAAATGDGELTIKWGDDQRSPGRWFINLAHPVVPDGSRATSPTALALSEATRDAHRTERAPRPPLHGEERAVVPVSPLGSDGIHLAIAKRLCELLHASLELEATDEGLQYRVTLPKAYAGEADPST